MPEIVERGMYCKGCTGDRSVHWSVNDDGSVSCGLLECAVDRKGLASCSECDEFPCDRLTAWSRENDRYAGAFARLRKMREAEGSV